METAHLEVDREQAFLCKHLLTSVSVEAVLPTVYLATALSKKAWAFL